MKKLNSFAQLYLRIAIGAGYLVFGFDRLGCWGPNGSKNVAWGDWSHFMQYAGKVMSFLPFSLANILAMIATGAEIILGILLITGLFTSKAALGSGVLALLFALSMAISFGIVSPLSYSVFTLSAASFLLSTVENFQWSIDAWLQSKAVEKAQRLAQKA